VQFGGGVFVKHFCTEKLLSQVMKPEDIGFRMKASPVALDQITHHPEFG